MKKLVFLIVISAILVSLSASCLQAKDKKTFTVWIGAAKENGFVDPGAMDSANDLFRAMRSCGFKTTSKQEQADFTVMVTGRKIGSEITGSTTSIGKGFLGLITASNRPVYTNWKYVFITIKSGSFEKQFYGSSAGLWKQSTSAIAKMLKKWAQLNADEIAKKKNQEVPAS